MADNLRERSAVADALAGEMRAERAGRRLTLGQMGEQSGLPMGTYRRLEWGERVADVSQLERVARAFGMTASDLLARAERLATPRAMTIRSARTLGAAVPLARHSRIGPAGRCVVSRSSR